MHYSMAALECADFVVVSAVDTGTSWILNDAPHFSRPTQVTSSRDPFPHSFCRLHFTNSSQSTNPSGRSQSLGGRNIGMMMLDQSCQLAILGLKSKTSAAPCPRDPMAFADALPHRMVINPRKDLVDARIERCELSGLRVDTPEPRSYWKHNWLS